MANANLYFDEINIERYLSANECKKCGATSCKELLQNLIERRNISSEISSLLPEKARSLQSVLNIKERLPDVPQLSMPRTAPPGLTELNSPKNGDPILVTGNNEFTQEVLMTVLSFTRKPFFFLSVDTRGDSLDMAIILKTFTPETVQNALDKSKLSELAKNSRLILPGKADQLAPLIKESTGMPVEVGPVCAAELPLYFGKNW